MIRVPALVIPVGPVVISGHMIFESLAYALGFWLYQRDRTRCGDVIGGPDRNTVIVAAILGAAVGSKLLACFEIPGESFQSWAALLTSGKTIVGGLLGGTMAVEWVKARLRIQVRTGDLFVIPIALGMAVGRIGCFFGGIQDHTYGTVTNVAWAVDFGDGQPRHPVQLYEVVFLLGLAAVLARARLRPLRSGDLFRIFLTAYLAFRLGVEFLKPEPAFGGLSSIQWVCAAALLWYGRDVIEIVSRAREARAHG